MNDAHTKQLAASRAVTRKQRLCLMCQKQFSSEHNANRICGNCKQGNALTFRCANPKHNEMIKLKGRVDG